MANGGYYDNYGISSLAQWLEEVMIEGGPVKRALILQIRAFPVGEESRAISRRSRWRLVNALK